MKEQELNCSPRQWDTELNSFLDIFGRFFHRSEPREQFGKYVKALLGPVGRKTCWQMAEHAGDRVPDPMQRLLYRSCWDVEAVRDEMLSFVIKVFGDDNGIGVLDETGYLKKGDHSAGAQRQYTGTAGKIENCQVGTFLTYATGGDHCFLDRRLYLPESWCDDPEKRQQAKIPDDVRFQTKPEQGIEMLKHAWAQGVPMRWVTGDTVYGASTELRNTVHLAGKNYVFAVASTITAWKGWPEPLEKKGRRSRHPNERPRYPRPSSVSEIIAGLRPQRWKRRSVGDGSKGHRVYDWARVRVVENHDGYPTREAWLLARRSTSDPSDIAYYLSNALDETLLKLATVAATRYTIEQCFEEAKGETGLDHYEVRNWISWYRHITLSMIAHCFLAWIRARNSDYRGGLHVALALLSIPEIHKLIMHLLQPRFTLNFKLEWSLWRRKKEQKAKTYHYGRWRHNYLPL